jgi:hypothetical protein
MNSGLKSLISSLFDLEKLTIDSVNRNYALLAFDSMAIMGDISQDVALSAGIQAECLALHNAANQTDLIAFLQQKFAGIEQLSTAKAQAILVAVVGLVNAGIALEAAFKN